MQFISYPIIKWIIRCLTTSLITIRILNMNFAWAQTTYYIDSQNGDDNNDGLSKNTAWKSHTMVTIVTFQPGDTIAFKKSSQFTGPIQFSDSGTEQNPIVITSYGVGERPRFTNPDDLDMNGNCIRISGSWIILEGLYFHDTPPTENASRLESIFLMGAVLNMKGADHNIIRDNIFIKCTKAIQSTGEYTLITHNYMDGPNHALWNDESSGGGWGPMGIQLGIGNQEVCYNTIKNYLTTDSDYGSDGGAIELDDGRFHKDNFFIHHNYSEGNAGFIESSWGADYNPYAQEVHNLRVAFNVNFDGQDWLYMWAPCHDCYFDNNTVIRSHDFTSPLNDVAYLAFGDIHFRNNLIIHTWDAYQGPGVNGIVTENNWYLNINNWSEIHWDASQAGSGDPGLVDLANGDYHLNSDSPLLGKGTNLSEYYSVDYEGNPLPDNGAWDIGAFQFQGSVNITSPEAGELFYVPAEITINADVTDININISRVEFYFNSNKLGEDHSFPYNYTWNVDRVGNYQLTATATSDNGAVMNSNSVWILVTDSCRKEECIWHSYDVVTDTDFQPATVLDQEGNTPTVIELYMSSNAGGVDRENLFHLFSTSHIDRFNHVEDFWSNIKGKDAYPYAGKSTVDRGSDSGESNTPEPSGVRDLQLHPPDNDHLTVASFMAPFDGNYSISDLAVRRVHNQGSIVTYKVFDASKNQIAILTASNDRAWVKDGKIYEVGFLSASDRIYFAVDRGENDNYYWDATEIAWTVIFDGNATDLEQQEANLSKEFILEQNYPNPFNSNTIISFNIPKTESVIIDVYDIKGQKICTLLNNKMTAGNHSVKWNGRNNKGNVVPSGIYFYRIKASLYQRVKRMLFIK
jgi:hypothetical protein